MSEITPHLVDYLPAIYAEDQFVQKLMAAFEGVLLGKADDSSFPARGLEQTIDRLDRLFDPRETPEEFVTWLAGWTALSLQADLTLAQQRDFIAQVIPLYQRRGTKENLQKLLTIFTQSRPEVLETGGGELQVGVSSRVGQDTVLGGSPPHIFEVVINLPRLGDTALARQIEIARALIDLEKPAHTNYTLTTRSPTMQIGVHSTIGTDTILGTSTDT
jgi:phage tail-like protein